MTLAWQITCRVEAHDGADFELDALAYGKPFEFVSLKRREMGEIRDVPYEAGDGIEDALKPRCLC